VATDVPPKTEEEEVDFAPTLKIDATEETGGATPPETEDGKTDPVSTVAASVVPPNEGAA